MATIYPRFETLPEGWTFIKGATNHPKGWKWISNGKSLFDPERKIALLKDNN